MCFTGSVWRLLEPLRADDREAFLALARRRTFARNEVLCHEGDPADSLHLVEHGHLAVHGGLASGATATFTILSSGDYFGELALLRADHRRTATVTALEPSRTLAVAATAFDALCSRNPGIERIVSALLADRIDILSRRLLETMYESLDRRVYRRLLELARSYGGSERHRHDPVEPDPARKPRGGDQAVGQPGPAATRRAPRGQAEPVAYRGPGPGGPGTAVPRMTWCASTATVLHRSPGVLAGEQKIPRRRRRIDSSH